ncbi:MAG: ankyrin repeat domain-containing protein, partial [Anaerolineae bacterium]
MKIQGFTFVPVENAALDPSIPGLHIEPIGIVKSHSKDYVVYIVIKDADPSLHIQYEGTRKIQKKIQKCLDNLPSFCKGPECWGEAGFRFKGLRIPNTFETANLSECGGDIFERCKKIAEENLSPVETSQKSHEQALGELMQLLSQNSQNPNACYTQAKHLIDQLIAAEKNGARSGDYQLSILHYLTFYGDAYLVNYALSQGADSNACDTQGGTCIHLLFNPHFLQFMEHEFSIRGFYPNAISLRSSALVGNLAEILDALVQHKADINSAYRQDGMTALHLAVRHCMPEMTQLLLSRQANPNVKDETGCTPLFYVNNPLTAELLLAAGAKATDRDNEGHS